MTNDGGQKSEIRSRRGCSADLAIMQTDQLRIFVEHQDEEIIVVVLCDIDRLGYSERFDQVRYRVSVTDD